MDLGSSRLGLLLNIGIRAGVAGGGGGRGLQLSKNFGQLRLFGQQEQFGQSQFLKMFSSFFVEKKIP